MAKVIPAFVGSVLLTLASAIGGVHATEPAKASLYVFLFEPGPSWVKGKPMEQQDLRDHAIYHARLVKQQASFAAGGFIGQPGGMALIRASSLAEATQIRDADPAIKNGVFVVRVVPWLPRFVSSAPLLHAAP